MQPYPQNSVGPVGIHAVVLREEAEVLAKALPIMAFPAVPENQGGPSWLDISKCDAHPQEGLEGGSRKLPACQPTLVPQNVIE